MMDLSNLPNRRKDEKVVLFLRRHWIEVVRILSIFLLFFILPLVAAFIFREGLIDLFRSPVWGALVSVVISIYILGIWLITFIEYTDYYLDTWIVTTERIINIEQHGLFRRIASELHLSDIQDVTSDVNGVLQITMNYGDVYIQTAGETTRFNFKNVPDPEKVKQRVLLLVNQDRQRHQTEAMATVSVNQQVPAPPVETVGDPTKKLEI